MKKRHQQKLVIVSILSFIGLNIPIVLLFDSSANFLGFPVVYMYLFLVCLVSILITLVIVKRYNE